MISEKILKNLKVSCNGKEPQKYFLECKEPEMWEEEFENWPLYSVPADCIRVFGEDKQGNIYKGFAVNPKEITITARLSAAAEERKRLCEEMKKKIKKLEITEKKGFVEMVFGDKRKEKIRIHSNMDVGYNQAIEDILSLIESIKNKI